MTQFMRRVNPVSKETGKRPMFGPKITKFVEEEAVDPIELVEEAPKEEFVCEVCGLVAKSRIGLVGHKRIHKK